jgi:hypothetical protein
MSSQTAIYHNDNKYMQNRYSEQVILKVLNADNNNNNSVAIDDNYSNIYTRGAKRHFVANADGNDNVINHLDIAEGLKDMLVSHGFNLESLLIMRPHNLAEILRIDQYVAKIIISAAHNIKNKS